MRQALCALMVSCLSMGCMPRFPADPAVSGAQTKAQDLLRGQTHLHPSLNIPGLNLLAVEGDREFRITLKCEQTPMHLLLPLLFRRTGASFQLSQSPPVFWVTADLKDLPLERCLDVLFEGSDFKIVAQRIGQDTLWQVLNRYSPLPEDLPVPDSYLACLEHIPAPVLNSSLFGAPGSFTATFRIPQMQTSSIDTGSIAIAGDRTTSVQLAHQLRKADQVPPTVLLRFKRFTSYEELILTYFGNNTGGFDFSWGPFTGIAFPNNLSSGIAIANASTEGTFSGRISGDYLQTAYNPLQVSANISGLLQRIGQHYTADVELAVLSGQSVVYKSGRVGQILSPVYSNGLVTETAIPVDAETTIQATPIVLPSGDIRLQVTYNSYRLIPNTLRTLVGSTRGSAQTTTVQMPSGCSAILTGYRNSVAAESVNGWPEVRSIPVLGFFLGAQQRGALENLGILVVSAEVVAAAPNSPYPWTSTILENPTPLVDALPPVRSTRLEFIP
jgi:hypothetical protein